MEDMNWKKYIKKALCLAFEPIRRNANFFTFMYILGVLTAVVTLPRWRELYDNLYLELFFDLYIVCAVLALIPKKVRFCIRGVLYLILYAVAIADVYCFVNFGSTLNPSMLMLVGETNSSEASNFIAACLSTEVIFSSVGWVLLLILVQILTAFRRFRHFIWKVSVLFASFSKPLYDWLTIHIDRITRLLPQVAGFCCIALFIWSACTSWHNKMAIHKLMTGKTIGEVEHTLTEKDCANLYMPIYRLNFSIYANKLAANQITQLIHAADKVEVDTCTYRSPQIVLIIGESFGKQHSQQYGYFMDTTPYQVALEKTKKLTKFTDVVTCWNLTSFVFKNVFSTHVIGEKGEWCDYPLFPELFRKAGYHTSFITNQFLPKAKEAVYDFSGGFFLNHPELSEAMFDTRNTKTFAYDEGLLSEYDEHLKKANTAHNLILFHLMGQHVNYRQRYPKGRGQFRADDYKDRRPELNHYQRRVLSEYDNATLYNDSIVDQIVRRFANEDAIVIYVPDHGEECFEGSRGFICRNHSAAIDYDLAHYEFEVPFWIWCSKSMIAKHPELYQEIRTAKDRRLMTDALPHTLLYLAGIKAPDYHEAYNVLSPKYQERRPRILKNQADYDRLRSKARSKK